jgi:hypothetical protein
MGRESTVPTRVVVTFVDEGVSAVAELLEDQAPKTCAAVLAALPQRNKAHHATYSGSEVAIILDRDLDVGKENATIRVIPGDLCFARFDGGVLHGFPDAFSELCWFYDRDATPSMPDGPLPPNIFGRFVEGFEEFAAVCRRMRREGVKEVEIRVE